jgi:hypothetical protein
MARARALFQLVAKHPQDFPMPIDWHILGYVAAVVVVTGILAGLAPALESVRLT